MKIKKCIIIRYGELFLKGKNRCFFIQKLITNLDKARQKNVFSSLKIRQFYDQLIITSEEEGQLTNFFSHLEKVFGISVFY
jgi:thiamine biosynthesis protein ThiI